MCAAPDLDQVIADAIYDALRSRNCGGETALVSGRPGPKEPTAIDGSFYLRAVARRVRKRLEELTAKTNEGTPV
jgi:hypothetical protein